MRRHRIFVVTCILALALGAGYFLHRSAFAGRSTHIDAPAIAQPESKTESATAAQKQSQHRIVAPASSAPLPWPGTPLKDTYDELKARADAGDAAAASRLFRDIARCRLAHRFERSEPEMLSVTAIRDDKKNSADQLTAQNNILNFLQKQVDFVKQSNSTCAGVDTSLLDDEIPASLRAAQLGDGRALDCYVGMEFMDAPGLLDHPEWLTQYKSNAMMLAQTALQNGDWIVVSLLQDAYSGRFGSALLGQLTGTDQALYYRYLVLNRLGTNDEFAGYLDRKITEASSSLTPDQISSANAWAQDAYSRYFKGSTSNQSSTCLDLGEF